VFRRLLMVFLIFIVVIVIAADRVGEAVAAHVLADKLQTDEHLPSKPSTSIGGIPFLTQAFDGKYKNVSVTAHDFVTDGVTVSTLTVHMHGVHIPLSKVVHGSVKRVPVDHIDGVAVVSFPNIESYLSKRGLPLTITGSSSGALQVLRTVKVGTDTVKESATATVSISDNVIALRLSNITERLSVIGGGTTTLKEPAAVKAVTSQRLFSVPLLGLPFRVQLHSVTASTTGVSCTGSANHIVLGG
jgi:DUF2993 family protein